MYLYAQGYKSKENEWKSYFNWHLEDSERNTEKVAALVANSDFSERLSKLEKLAKSSPIPFVGVLKLFKRLGFLITP